MVIREVLMLGNPKLRDLSLEIIIFDESLEENLHDLKDTLTHLQKTKKLGSAIAAPQIGSLKKIIYYQLPGKSFYMVNPKITQQCEEVINVWDSCFSFDIAFFVEIPRYKSIKVEYQDKKGNFFHEVFTDDLSELVQHEIDHLNGILAIDHLRDVKKIIMRSEWERRFR
jgi:peptide deformylase